jgi:hypothetical protein
MSSIWIDPRNVDWTDGLNPLTRRRYAENVNRYVHDALDEPVTQALRASRGAMRVFAVPDESHAILAPSQVFDLTINPPPFVWLVAFSAHAEQPEGFLAQITDTVTGQTIFSQPIHSASIGNPASGGLLYLSMPAPILPPSRLAVRLTNLAPAGNRCQLAIWVIQEDRNT